MSELLFVERKIGQTTLRMYGISLGVDLCIVLSGGDSPHVGAAVLSQARPSLRDLSETSATTSILAVLGHKEDRLFKNLGEEAARKTGGNVVVCGGVHVDDARTETIDEICSKAEEMLAELLSGKDGVDP